jgi:hypothetical protein
MGNDAPSTPSRNSTPPSGFWKKAFGLRSKPSVTFDGNTASPASPSASAFEQNEFHLSSSFSPAPSHFGSKPLPSLPFTPSWDGAGKTVPQSGETSSRMVQVLTEPRTGSPGNAPSSLVCTRCPNCHVELVLRASNSAVIVEVQSSSFDVRRTNSFKLTHALTYAGFDSIFLISLFTLGH